MSFMHAMPTAKAAPSLHSGIRTLATMPGQEALVLRSSGLRVVSGGDGCRVSEGTECET